MEYSKIVSYVKQFSAQGLPLDACYAMLYLTQEEIDMIETDQEVMDEIKHNETTIILNRLQDYNRKVDLSQSPSDALKRMQSFAPHIFKEVAPQAISGELVIKKVRMSD